ncbi:preprotein translocase subunit SecE [Clostridium sp. BJN0001]|uniref:preprotein translocase subunit SecE n=1 Tax=Clostridium sp. BJN0001 TaxID=2930219 RepID=UPI001FD35288|nr:preprotein translocase subunit SecE [Clostridium sp. BJN0001]
MSVKSNIQPEKASKKNMLFDFFRGVKSELKIIIWPSKDETKKAFIAVLVFSLIFIILVGGFDFVFKHLFQLLLKLK